MKITAIILSHYYERRGNLTRIIGDLQKGSVVPDEIVVFVDHPDIDLKYDGVTIIKSNVNLLPKIRFSLATYFESDYFLFIDDDLSVRHRTVENFVKYAKKHPHTILGLEGSILGPTDRPYSSDTPIGRGPDMFYVDVIIRTYFVPRECLIGGLQMYVDNPDLPRKSLDDVYLCLGNQYISGYRNLVIPVDDESNLLEIGEFDVGQSKSGEHYQLRNDVCYALMEKYGKCYIRP